MLWGRPGRAASACLQPLAGVCVQSHFSYCEGKPIGKGREGAAGRSGPELAQLPRGFWVTFADSGWEPAGLRFPNDQVRLVGPCTACWVGLPVQGEGRGLAAAEGA